MNARVKSNRIRRMAVVAVIMALVSLGLAASLAGADYVTWHDIGIVYSAPATGDAYYPSVIYDAAGFGGGRRLYKLWYSDGAGRAFVVTSTNGIDWNAPITSTGLSNPHHVQVLYDVNCFGALPCDASASRYKIWYWDSATTYSIADLAMAQSADGVNWTGNAVLAQSGIMPLVTGAGVGWNRGTYGPLSLFYQAGASNTGADPWNYSYVMYYDGTDGSSEVTGLAYSSDGVTWTGYSTLPVLDKGAGNAWDCDDAAYGTVYRDAMGYHFWYSGGGGDNGSGGCQAGAPVYQGIGYASSVTGASWTKSASNPILHINDGVSHRNRRVYTPAVIDDGSGILKMYYSAQAVSGDTRRRIGLALNPTAPITTYVDDDWMALPQLTPVTFPGNLDAHFIGIDAFPTVMGGINAVTPRGAVMVAAGAYGELITVTKSLTLQGAGAGNTVITGTNSGRGIYLPDNTNGVTLTQLTVRNFQDGLVLGSASNVITNVALSDVEIISNTRHGLYSNARLVTGVTVRRATVSFNGVAGSAGRGIFFQASGSARNQVAIVDSTLNSNLLAGIDFNIGQASGITVTGNMLADNGDCGICVLGPFSALIDNNRLTNNGRFGIEIKNPAGDGTLNGTNRIVVSNNAISRTAPFADQRDYAGIAVERRDVAPADGNPDVPAGVVVIGNTVSGYTQTSGHEGFGIVVEGRHMYVSNNVVSGNDVGIQVQAGNGGYPGNSNTGSAGAPAPNTPYLDRGNSPATCAFVSGNTVTGNITDTRSVGAVSPTVQNVNTGLGFCSIQSAIADVTTLNGHVLNLAAGVFDENVVITKSLTLAGAGQGSTVIRPAASSPNPCSPDPLCSGAASSVLLVQANDVVIHDLTIDGDNPALTSGIMRGGADLDARNGIITDRNLGDFTGLQVFTVTVKNVYLRGIMAQGGAVNWQHNTVQNVQGDDYSIGMFNRIGTGTIAYNAVDAANDAISANWSKGTLFLSNTVVHSGSGVHTDNNGGLGGVADLIQGNAVSDCKPGGYGVWVFAPFAAQTIRDNTISRCDVGLAAFGQNAPVTPVFSGNQASGGAIPNSLGLYASTSLLGWGSANASVVFTGNQIVSFTHGVYVEQELGYHLNLMAGDNVITASVESGATFTGTGTFDAALRGNTMGGGLVGVRLASVGTMTAAGNALSGQTTAFSQSTGTLAAYANSITGFVTGVSAAGGARDLRHNWWGAIDPTGVNDADAYDYRLGAPIVTWGEGTLGGASISGGTGVGVIVDHGRTTVPFGKPLVYSGTACSSMYDFFAAPGAAGTWMVTVPVDAVPECDATFNRGALYHFALTAANAPEANCAPNSTCWITYTNVVSITGAPRTLQTSVSTGELGGTPIVAGSTQTTSPTAVTLTYLTAVSDKRDMRLPVALIMGLFGSGWLVVRFKRR